MPQKTVQNCPDLKMNTVEGTKVISPSQIHRTLFIHVSSPKILFIYSILTVSLNLFNQHSTDFLSLKKIPLLNFSIRVSVIFICNQECILN